MRLHKQMWDNARKAGVFYKKTDTQKEEAVKLYREELKKLKVCEVCGEFIHGEKCENYHP